MLSQPFPQLLPELSTLQPYLSIQHFSATLPDLRALHSALPKHFTSPRPHSLHFRMEKEARLVQLFVLVLGCAGQHFRRPNALSLLPQDPLVHLGDPVQFNCSMNCPKAIFTWKGLDTKSGSVTSASHYSLLSIASTAVHNEGRIICEAACHGRRMQQSSQLNLYSFPDTLQLAQHPAHLICSIRRVYPLDSLVLRWYKGEHKLHTEEQQDISDQDDEKDEVQSYQLRLDLPESVATKGATYRCEAELRLDDATIQRNKTMIFSMPAGQTAGIKNATHTEQPMMEMPITKDTPSTKSGSSKEQAAAESETLTVNFAMQALTTSVNPTTETAATRLNPTPEAATARVNSTSDHVAISVNPTTETAVTRLNPTTEAAAARVNPTSDHVAIRVNPTTETAATRLHPTTEAATARVNPTTDTATARVNPTSDHVATGLNPTTDTAMTVKNPTTEHAAIRVIPTSETLKNKEHPMPGMYGIKDNLNDTSNTRLKPITVSELYATTEMDTIHKQTVSVTISRIANPTRRAPPKSSIDVESIAICSVFSVLGLLSSCVGVHQLWKRLSFLDPKKGSFDLGQV